jgi:ABC-type antimicrobial peptide transport system permease subunit
LAAFEPIVLAAVSVGLAALGMVAMMGPARRAGRADPAVALRAE